MSTVHFPDWKSQPRTPVEHCGTRESLRQRDHGYLSWWQRLCRSPGMVGLVPWPPNLESRGRPPPESHDSNRRQQWLVFRRLEQYSKGCPWESRECYSHCIQSGCTQCGLIHSLSWFPRVHSTNNLQQMIELTNWLPKTKWTKLDENLIINI